MKKAVLLTSTILLWAGMAVAQDTSANTANQSQTTSSAQQTLQGCLSKSGDSYNLNASGQQFKVSGSDLSQLQGKENHTVSISGTVSGSEISLQSATDIAATCDNSGSAANTSSTGSSDNAATGATLRLTPQPQRQTRRLIPRRLR
jgi:hypothetical protein